MDISIEKADGTTIGSLFQHIINDMKNSSPVWEDFIMKATKLHACLRAAIQAISAYLEAFQKIADAATNSKGASKEIGTALTRVCLRHKAVETRMKTFTTAIMDCLILPLQDKLEEWKRQVAGIDKEHTKEYKRCRSELKKRSTDTLRLQKKAKKSTSDNLQGLVESSLQTVTLQRAELEEVERKSLRQAMIEDRTRYCSFVNMLQPVVKSEYEVMYELGHLQEAMQTITNVTKDPTILPQASEELILESKTSFNFYPDSPSGSNSQGGGSNSLGSRKSSVCSISSMNSSSSGSPGHQFQRSLSQYSPAIRLKPGESSDSGFCSSPALTSQASTVTGQSHAVSTWPPHVQEAVTNADRPHTISTAYERGHQRPALTVYTFQNPETIDEAQKSPVTLLSRPPLPIRCSSLERPLSATSNTRPTITNNGVIPRNGSPSPIPSRVTKEHPPLQPTYVNMTELASMAASKNTNSTSTSINQHLQQQILSMIPLTVQPNSPALSTTSSLVSPDSCATNPISISSPDVSSCSVMQTPQPGSPTTPLAGQCGSLDDLKSTSTTPRNQSPDRTTNTIYSSDSKINQEEVKETDLKSSGSVLEKLSMFEKTLLEQHPVVQATPPPTKPAITLPTAINNNLTPATVARLESIYGKKTEEIYKAAAPPERDSDQIDKDTIEELNNLIGELDLFQKEHESSLQNLEQRRRDKVAGDKMCGYQSLNYSVNSSDLSSKFNYSDGELNKYNWNNNNDCTDYTSAGFENPSFLHLNDHNIVVIRENEFPATNHYNSGEIVVLRCKESGRSSNNNSITDLSNIDSDHKLRLSSFKNENNNSMNASVTSNGSGNSISSYQNPFLVHDDPPVSFLNQLNVVNINQTINVVKPAITPRPASLASANASRIARRSSVNTVKPPPPVRRSSSVTPSHHVDINNSQNLLQHQNVNVSTESLPPPPAYLLDRSVQSSPSYLSSNNEQRHQNNGTNGTNGMSNGNYASHPNNFQILQSIQNAQNAQNAINAQHSQHLQNVAGAVKQLHDLRHSPASPNVQRRSLAQNHHSASSNNHPHPPQSNTVLYNQTTQLPKSESNSMFSIYGSTTGSSVTFGSNTDIYGTTPRQPKAQPAQPQGIYAQPKQIPSVSSFRNTPSPGPGTPKQSSGLMAQLAARIAPSKPQVPPPAQPEYTERSRKPDYQSSEPTYPPRRPQPPIPAPKAQTPQYFDHQNQNIYSQQSSFDGKNPIYSSSNQSYQQQNQQPLSQFNQNIYVSTNPFISPPSNNYSPSSFGKDVTGNYSNYQATGQYADKSVLQKTNPSFLENLNAKLAEQSRVSGKAYAVRSYINGKAVPDPRICHESLMDQIKRGAALKQNSTTNDRSAPKIL